MDSWIIHNMVNDLLQDRVVKGGNSKTNIVVNQHGRLRHMTVTIDQAIYLLSKLTVELLKQEIQEMELERKEKKDKSANSKISSFFDNLAKSQRRLPTMAQQIIEDHIFDLIDKENKDTED